MSEPAAEPRTAAGQRLLHEANADTELAYRQDSLLRMILAIEAESSAALREALERLVASIDRNHEVSAERFKVAGSVGAAYAMGRTEAAEAALDEFAEATEQARAALAAAAPPPLDVERLAQREIEHSGRAWSGHEIEDACPCPQEPCGLVSAPDPECTQHGHSFARTLRQGHRATDCPVLAPPDPEAVRLTHEPGEPHRHRIECEVCGQRGTLNLSIEPQSSLAREEGA